MREPIFCQNCKIRLSEGLILGLGKSKFYEFSDGNYCEKCAKIKVERSRKC